jgi:molybdate transport repressor ModE-like protein
MAPELDLASLRLVRAIADHGTITGAATALGCTQPAVSQHIRRLERRLGTAVLERHARGVRLTQAGRVLARYGATVTASVEAAEREVSALAGLRAGSVRVIAFDAAAATILPAALTLLRAEAPEVEIDLKVAETAESVAGLRDGRCDIALAVDFDGPDTVPPTGPQERTMGLTRRRLLSDPSVLALAEDHPLSSRRRLHLRDLSGAEWITSASARREHLLASARAAGFTPRVRCETDDYATTFALVAAGAGIALLPALVSDLAAARGGIRLHSVGGVRRRPVCALTTPDLLRVPAVAATLDALTEAAAVL